MDPRDGEFVSEKAQTGARLLAALRGFRPNLSWSQLRGLVERGHIKVNQAVERNEARMLSQGDVVAIAIDGGRAQREVPRLPKRTALTFAHRDRDVVVVHKPAGMPTVPHEGNQEPTLDAEVARQLDRHSVLVVQRLDRDTTGLLVFALNPEAEQALAQQLRFHTLHRRYLALVHGDSMAKTIRSYLAEDRGDGLRGSVSDKRFGKLAVTHVAVEERLRGATLVACTLETGRTHQIRIHMAEDGHMVLGERGYVREHVGPLLPAARICLHAAELGFVHPRTKEALRFSAALPPDMAALRQDLRAGGPYPT